MTAPVVECVILCVDNGLVDIDLIAVEITLVVDRVVRLLLVGDVI